MEKLIYKRIFQEDALKLSDIKDCCLFVDTQSESGSINFTLYNPSSIVSRLKKSEPIIDVFKDSILAMVEIGKEGKIKVPQMAWKINFIAAKPESKAGVLMYDIAMSYVSKKGQGLTPDRQSVSQNAQKVWKYYFTKRNDIKKIPIDNYKEPVTKNKKDDGGLYTLKNLSKDDIDKGYNDRSFINYIYVMTKPLNYFGMMKNHNDFLKELYTNFKNVELSEFIIQLRNASAEFFNEIYEKNAIVNVK